MNELKRFATYNEAMSYLSDVFNRAGYWVATLSWSERNETEERPYKLFLEQPSLKMRRNESKSRKEA